MNTLKVLWAVASGLFFIVTSVLMFIVVGTMLGLSTQTSLLAWLVVPVAGVVSAVQKARQQKRHLSFLHAAAVQAEREAEAAQVEYDRAVAEYEQSVQNFTVVERYVPESVVDKPLWQSLNLKSF